MMSKPVRRLPLTSAAGWLPAVIGIHLGTDLLLINRALFLDQGRLLLIAAVPLSQVSLASLWAVKSESHPYLRFTALPLVVVGCWYVLSRVLPWGINEPASAAWMIALVVQTLTILIACKLYQLASDLVRRRRTGVNSRDHLGLTFQLRTLVLWTTIIAMGFGFIQYGRTHWGWTARAADSEFLTAMPLIGLLNACLAVLWLWALATGNWKKRTGKIVLAVCLIAVLGASVSQLIGWLTQFLDIGVDDTLVLAAAQSLLIAGSIAVVLIGNSIKATPSCGQLMLLPAK